MLIILIIAVCVLLSGCSDRESEIAEILGNLEIFEFYFEPFADELVFRTEYDVHPVYVDMIFVHLYSHNYYMGRGWEFLLVKQVGDEWLQIPLDGRGWYGNFLVLPPGFPGGVTIVRECPEKIGPYIHSSALIDGMFIPGIYRIIMHGDVSLFSEGDCRLEHCIVWRGPIWAEFEVR